MGGSKEGDLREEDAGRASMMKSMVKCSGNTTVVAMNDQYKDEPC